MRYMIAPTEITLKELEVYRLLYKKMDFNTFEVKYTLDQLSLDSDKILCLTKRKVEVIVKKLIDDKLLSVVKKGVKGKPTIYKINKIKGLMCDESVENIEQKCDENVTNNGQINVGNTCVDNDIGTNNGRMCDESVMNNGRMSAECVTPIKDKDKDKESIERVWKLYPKKTDKKKAITKIAKIIKEIGEDKLIECINNYEIYIQSTKNGNWIQSYMGGDKFFSGRYIDYLESVEIKEVNTIKSNLTKEIKEVDRETAFVANSAEDVIARIKMLQNK